MLRRSFAVAVLSCFCAGVFAGDEVDYSAPYMTLEDGKLVTKYPAKEHDPNAPQADDVSIGETAAAPRAEPTPLGIVLTLAMFALAVFLSRGSGSKAGP